MIEHVQMFVIPAAFALLPATMRSPEANAMLLAIGLQESRFAHRRQIKGPARGFWQFEAGGVRGVLEHQATRAPIADVFAALRYPVPDDHGLALFTLEDNDTLAAAFARCLLYTLPDAMPGEHAASAGWDTYVAAWRPGKPHRATWDNCYAQAWALTLGLT